MTERVDAVFVALERPTRADDLEPTLEAIRQLRGVLRVEPAPNVGMVDDWVAKHRAYQVMHRALWEETFGCKKRSDE